MNAVYALEVAGRKRAQLVDFLLRCNISCFTDNTITWLAITIKRVNRGAFFPVGDDELSLWFSSIHQAVQLAQFGADGLARESLHDRWLGKFDQPAYAEFLHDFGANTANRKYHD